MYVLIQCPLKTGNGSKEICRSAVERYQVSVDRLEAVHGVLGVIPKDAAEILSTAAAGGAS